MSVSANRKGSRVGDISNFASLDLPPMSKQSFTVPAPEPTNSSQPAEITFSLKCGEEFLHGLIYAVEAK